MIYYTHFRAARIAFKSLAVPRIKILIAIPLYRPDNISLAPGLDFCEDAAHLIE